MTVGCWFKAAEQSVALVERTRGEKEGINASGAAVIAEAQSPKTFELNRTLVDVFEKAVESAVRPEGHDRAVSEITHQQVAGMCSKGERRQGHTPGRVDLDQPAARVCPGGEPIEGPGLRVKHVDQSAAAARIFITFRWIAFGEHDEHPAVD